MSVKYNGRTYKVKRRLRGRTLNLSIKHIGNITSIKGLQSLTKLKVLDLSHNNIGVIKGLESLINLRRLNLEGNYIRSIEGLDNQKNLKRLNLYKNKVFEIKSLPNIRKLKWCAVGENPIYTELEWGYRKKRKLKKITEQERGISPFVWKIINERMTEKFVEKPMKWYRTLLAICGMV